MKLLADDDPETDDEPTIELWDSRSSDFWKLKVGETRIDIMGGLPQLAVLATRFIRGTTKTSSGQIKNLRGPDRKYGAPGVWDAASQALRYKLGPSASGLADFFTGETAVGQPLPEGPVKRAAAIAGKRLTPMAYGDMWKAENELGLKRGTVSAIEAFFGASVGTHGDRTKYRDASEAERKEIVEKDIKNMAWDDPEKPAYSKFLTDDQLEQFSQRREEKQGLVIYNATYHGKNEDELKTRDKNREHLKEMTVPFEEAKRLLQVYYHRPDDNGKRGRLTEGYTQRLLELKRIYAE
jgi:hypothetical protein